MVELLFMPDFFQKITAVQVGFCAAVSLVRIYYAVFLSLFFRLASGRKIVILPIKQTNCTISTPASMPMLSMATSRLEGPRPATND